MTAYCVDCFICKHGQSNDEGMFVGCDSEECKYEPTSTDSEASKENK